MSSELVDPTKSLEDLMRSLNKGQRAYLYLRIMNVPKLEALQLANRKSRTEIAWRDEDNFRILEEYLIANREKYQVEAFKNFINSLGAKVQMVLDNMVDRALEWDDLKREDKPYIMQAVNLIAKLYPKSQEAKEGRSYDEIILKRHRIFQEEKNG